MANVKPFKAIRPSSALAAQVAALPYDVYNREEAAEKVKGHPLSFLNIDRPETQFDPSMDMYADCVYEKAKEMLDREIAEGIFVQDEQKCYYLYELTMNGRTQTGITACVSIDDYLHQVVKKHEDTRTGPYSACRCLQCADRTDFSDIQNQSDPFLYRLSCEGRITCV